MQKSGKDTVFALRSDRVGDFVFDDEVARVFPDMINRSVPGYSSILAMIGQLAEKFATPNSHVYDLGCSLGAATRLMRERIPASCKLHAVDNSAAMIKRLRALIAVETHAELCPVIIKEADIVRFPMSNASLCLLNFTLQFVPVPERGPLLEDIFVALRPGGALLLSEKICVESASAQQLLRELHEQFKRAHGYSELEVARKRSALENTLIPETVDTHLARLRSAGFEVAVPWFQCFNFASFLAVKSSD